MSDDITITPETCRLRHQLYDEKLAGVNKRVDVVEKSYGDVLIELGHIRDFQKSTFYAIIIVCVICIAILGGVVLGRGLDFGYILAGVP